MSTTSLLRSERHKQIMLCMIVVVGFVVIGLVALRFSSAITSIMSVESEDGTLTSNAALLNDTTASGGRALQFKPGATITNMPPQSAALAYNNNMSNVGQYARPGGLVVAGRDNYQFPEIKNVSAQGGSVLIYLDPLIDNPYGRYHELMLNASECGAAVPRWPGGPKASEWGYLTDFRVGGILQRKMECVLEKMVAENPHMAGWFADDLGSRAWFPLIDWNSWSQTDRQAYRDGAVALSQTFRKIANKYGLIFIVNGTWGAGSVATDGGGYPNLNQHGNALADGGFLENHNASTKAYFSAYGCSAQWAAQSPVTRGKAFNYSINPTAAEMEVWRSTGCYAFTAIQPDYGQAPMPYSTLRPTGLPSKVGNPVSL